MKTIFVCIFVVFCLSLYSQNWNLISLNKRYNYSLNVNSINNYHTTVFVDSVSVTNSDTLFYLNRLVSNCEICPVTFESNYLRYNQPTFLQRMVKKHDNIYTFYDTKTFTIMPNNSIGNVWVFDTIHNVTAQIISSDFISVLGTLDSVKYIKLSNDKQIIIAKNNGIIYFSGINLQERFILIGVESDNSQGFKLPNFYDFYNFNVGDVFQYKSESCGCMNGCDCSHSVYKITILSKLDTINSLTYKVQINGKYWTTIMSGIPNGPEHYSNRIDTLVFKDSVNNLANYYNNQLIVEDFYENYYSRVSVQFDNTGKITKNVGLSNTELKPFYEIDTTSTDLLINAPGPEMYDRTLAVGLGQINKSYSWFEAGGNTTLIGYKKGNDTVGTIYPDYVLNDDLVKLENRDLLRIYPNPSSSIVNIEKTDLISLISCQLYIYDVFGQVRRNIKFTENKITIDNLEKGIYFIELKSNDYNLIRKVAIN